MKREIAAIFLIVAVAISGAAGYFWATRTNGNGSTSTQTQTTCIISGQPADFYLRILSDGTLQPVTGAFVTATNVPAHCGGSPADSQVIQTFSSNRSEWIALDGSNNAGYSFVVKYSGQNYSLSGELRPISATCATLFLPSGRTNVTVAYGQIICK